MNSKSHCLIRQYYLATNPHPLLLRESEREIQLFKKDNFGAVWSKPVVYIAILVSLGSHLTSTFSKGESSMIDAVWWRGNENKTALRIMEWRDEKQT